MAGTLSPVVGRSVVGRRGDLSVRGTRGAVRAVREWFEMLPFRRGMSLLGIAVLVPAAVIFGTVLLGGGSGHPPSRAPDAQRRVPATPTPDRTWGANVPPRATVPESAPTRRGSLTLTRRHPVPAVTPRQRPSPGPSCPVPVKRYPWFWQMCNRHGHR